MSEGLREVPKKRATPKPKLQDFREKNGKLNIPAYAKALSEHDSYGYGGMTRTEINISQYFKRFFDHNDENYTKISDEDVERFYLEILPIAHDQKFRDASYADREKLYRDYAPYVSLLMPGTKYQRTFSATYTLGGIQDIEYYFFLRVRNCLTLEDAYEIEKQLVGCSHLHIILRADLLENLNEEMININS